MYKCVSLTYKLLFTSGPKYLSKLIAIQQPGRTRSTKLISLEWPATSRYTLSNRSFQYAMPQIWNSLPAALRTRSPSTGLAMPPAQFHNQLKTYLFSLSFPTYIFSNVGSRPSRKPPSCNPIPNWYSGYWIWLRIWTLLIAFWTGGGFP